MIKVLDFKNKIIHWDCIIEIEKLIEQWVMVDAIITDPPYNISRKTNFHTMKGHKRTSFDFWEWDKDFDLTSYIDKIPQILKEWGNVVIFNDWKNLWIIGKKMQEVWITPKRCLVINKSNPAPFNRDRMFVNGIECAIWWTYWGKWTFNREQPLEKCIIKSQVQNKKLHPTMKDLKVIEKLIRLLTNEWDLVLDCFAWSWTTWLAAKNLNRNFILIEKEKEYVDAIYKRLGA
jgi:site-specific DNA-methyltransferase (adenine-specific)